MMAPIALSPVFVMWTVIKEVSVWAVCKLACMCSGDATGSVSTGGARHALDESHGR